MSILPLTLLLLAAKPSAGPTAPPTQELELLGTVDDLDVHMSLRLAARDATARYAYATGTGDLFLRGQGLGAGGRLELNDAEQDSAPSESFKGTLDLAQHHFFGVWSKGGRSLPFSLQVLARLVPIGRKGRCGNMRVLAFELPDAGLSQALSAAARARAELAIKTTCTGDEEFGGSQRLSAMTDGLVSIGTSTGNGLPKGSGSSGVVLDTRVTPPRELAIEDGAVDVRKLRLALARAAERDLRQKDAQALRSVAGIFTDEDRLGDGWSGWAVTPGGLQLCYRQSDWAASGDGTVHAFVPRRLLVDLYRPESRLGRWARGTPAP